MVGGWELYLYVCGLVEFPGGCGIIEFVVCAAIHNGHDDTADDTFIVYCFMYCEQSMNWNELMVDNVYYTQNINIMRTTSTNNTAFTAYLLVTQQCFCILWLCCIAGCSLMVVQYIYGAWNCKFISNFVRSVHFKTESCIIGM